MELSARFIIIYDYLICIVTTARNRHNSRSLVFIAWQFILSVSNTPRPYLICIILVIYIHISIFIIY